MHCSMADDKAHRRKAEHDTKTIGIPMRRRQTILPVCSNREAQFHCLRSWRHDLEGYLGDKWTLAKAQ